MNPTVNLLEGELERLYTVPELVELCRSLLGFDPADQGLVEGGKAAFVRRLVRRCEAERSTLALTDAVQLTKSGLVDPRLRQALSSGEDRELPPGTRVGSFVVVEPQGEFSLGRVYQVVRESTPPPASAPGGSEEGEIREQSCRLEVVSGALSLDRSGVQRYLFALRALRRLNSHHFPVLLEVGLLADGRPWTVTEPLQGGSSLAELLRLGPLMLAQAWPVIDGVLEALEELHEHGLSHGGLKPSDVLVCLEPTEEDHAWQGQVVLLGTGSDRLLGGCTGMGAWVTGGDGWLAPERVRGGASDQHAELYGVGAFLYEIVTGRPVFSGRTRLDLAARHLMEEPRRPSAEAPEGSVPPELDELILQLLAKDPTRRPASLAVVRRVLEQCVSRLEVEATLPVGTIEDVEAAAELFLERPGEDERAQQLEEAARAAKAWGVAAAAVERAIEQTTDAEVRKRLELRLARIYYDGTGERERAETLYRSLWEADPTDVAVDGVYELVLRQGGHYEEVIQVLLARADRTVDPRAKAFVLRELAVVYERATGQPDQAFTVLLAAVPLDLDRGLLNELARLAGITGRWSDLVEVCSAVVQQLQVPELVVLLGTHMGHWYAEQLGRQDYAFSCYQQVLTIDPANADALDGMAEIYRRVQQWAELGQVMISRAEASFYPAERRDRLAAAAAVFADRANDTGRAREIFVQILDEDPAHQASLEALERLYTRTEAWEDLVALYHSQLGALTSAPEKGETWLKIATLAEQRLGDERRALEAYRQVLVFLPDHDSSLAGLARLTERAGAYRELLDVLKLQLERAHTPRRRAEMHERRARLLEEQFLDREAALAEYESLLSLDGTAEAALQAIERLQRALEHWDDLARTYDRHAAVAANMEQRLQLWQERARVLVEQLEDHEGAAQALALVAEQRPKDVAVLQDLARERLLSQDFEGAVAALERVASLTPEGEARANVWVRVGELYERKLNLPEKGEEAYRKALDADRCHGVAAAALQDRFVAQGQLQAARDMLERQLEAATGDLERSRILTELGLLCRDRLCVEEEAHDYFSRAVASDKSNSVAAEALLELYRARKQWQEAAGVYDLLSHSATLMPLERKRRFYRGWGETARELGDLDQALRVFSAALSLDESDSEVRMSVADTLFELQNWDQARQHYAWLAALSDQQPGEPEHQVRLLLRLAQTQRRGNELQASAATLDRILDLVPDQVEALRERASLAMGLGEHRQAAELLEELAEALTDEDERVKVFTDLGDLWAEQLHDDESAARSFGAALKYTRDDRNLLMRLMAVYNRTQQWPQLVEVVLRIADLETEPGKAARYYQTAAVINRRELGQAEVAREYYETALDLDPSLLNAFEHLVEILTEQEDWEALARSYQSMVDQWTQSGEPGQLVKLLDGLGAVLHRRLQRTDEALGIFERAQELDPQNRGRMEILAELYGEEGAQAEKAIELHRQLLQLNPYREESYKALLRTYAALGQLDAQWCCARTMSCLRMAEEGDEAFFQRHQREDIPVPGDRLTEELWQNLLAHEDQGANLTAIFEGILPAVRLKHARPLKAFHLDVSDARDVEHDDHPLCGLVRFAAGTLGMEAPTLFFREKVEESLIPLPTNPPALLAGGAAIKASYQNPRPLAFVLGRLLGYLKGGNALRIYMESDTMMRSWLLAAQKLVLPELAVPGQLAETVAGCVAKLSEQLAANDKDALRSLVGSFVNAGGKMDLRRWVSAVDFGADRAGFLLCDDLELAFQLIRLEQDSPTSAKDRLRELSLFSISPAYFALRNKLLIQLPLNS